MRLGTSHTIQKFACAGALLFLLCSVATAQDAEGKIAGVVTDQSGAVVPKASVTATNVDTKISKTVLTEPNGFYQIQPLPVGNYSVMVEAAGFSKVTTAPSPLEINQTLRVDVKLEVGKVSNVVVVESQGSRVETENSTVGGTVTGVAIAELPLNGRNTLDLLATQPGVTPTNPDSGAAGSYSIGGGRTDSVTYLIDGGLNNDLLSNGIVVNPNPDAIQEFRVLENSYGAEYGRNAGGIVSIVTKSGTNTLHGTLYDYVRNTDFDANDFFFNQQGLPRADLKRNQFGGTFGGPIVIPHIVDGRNKLFFFFAYQGQRQSQVQTAGQTVTYTPAEAQGNFSQASNISPTATASVAAFLLANPYYQSNPNLASQGIIDPTKIDPVAQAYFAKGLIPTSPTGLLYPTASAKANGDEYLGKLDFAATNKDTITGTFSSQDGYSTIPFNGANVSGYTSASFTQTNSIVLAYIHTFTPSLVNQARASAVRSTPDERVPVGSNVSVSPADLGINITPDISIGPPTLYFYGTGLTIGYWPNGPTSFADTTYAYYDDLSWIKGNHGLKFGFYFSPYENNTNYAFYTSGAYSFFGPSTSVGSGVDLADFLFGLPDNYFQASQAISNIRSHQYAGYGQDEWKVTRRLTMTIGLRYEYSEPKYDTEGRSFSFIPGLQSTRFVNAPPGLVFPGDPGAPKGVNFPNRTDFAPRFGFAWDVFGNAKTSLRGGYGRFFDVLKGEDNLQFNGSPPFYAEPNLYFNPVAGQTGSPGYLSNPFGTNNTGTPNGFPSVPPTSTVNFAQFEPFSGAIFLVNPHLKTPYVWQYNVDLQQKLPSNMLFELGYVGYTARGLTSLEDINPFPLGSNSRMYGFSNGAPVYYGFLDEFNNVSNADYAGMQTSLTRRMGDSRIGNAFFTLAYTWSHEIDNASGFRQRNSQVPYYDNEEFRASGDTDVRQVIALSGGWSLPFDRMWDKGPKLLTKGWTLYPIVSWRTGFPLDVFAGLGTTNSDPGPAGDGDAGLVHADLVLPTIATYNARNQQNIGGNLGNYYFNPLAFSNTQLIALDQLSQQNAALLVGQFTEGTFPRNALRGPGFVNTDVSLSKHFGLINEKLDTELRLEAFNVFNHTNFSNPNTNIESTLFGQVSTTQGPRIVELALHLRF